MAEKKTALTDPDSMILVDPAKEGSAEDDPLWRELVGFDAVERERDKDNK